MSNDESRYVSWTTTWDHEGYVDCDRPNPYITGAGSAVTVHEYNSEANHDYTNDTPVSYLYTTNTGEIYNMIPGKTYHWISTTDPNENGNVRATNTIRTLYIEDAMNSVIDNKPVYFHYTYGSDRTGTIAYILEGLLGVLDENKTEEFELSTLFGIVPRNRYYSIEDASNRNDPYKWTYLKSKLPDNEVIR